MTKNIMCKVRQLDAGNIPYNLEGRLASREVYLHSKLPMSGNIKWEIKYVNDIF